MFHTTCASIPTTVPGGTGKRWLGVGQVDMLCCQGAQNMNYLTTNLNPC